MANPASLAMPHSIPLSSSQESPQMQGAVSYVNPGVRGNAPPVPGVSNGQSVPPPALYGDGYPTGPQAPFGQRPVGQFAPGAPPSGTPKFVGPPPLAGGPQSFSSPDGTPRFLHPPTKMGTLQPSPLSNENSGPGSLPLSQVYPPGPPPSQTVMNGPTQMLGSTSQHPVTNGVLAHRPSGSQSSFVPRGLPTVGSGPPPVSQSLQPPLSGPPPLGSTGLSPVNRLPHPPTADWSRQHQNSLHVSQSGPTWPSMPPSSSSITPSPATSEPPSAKSSRNPSPIPNQRYDAMESQFVHGPNSLVNHTPGPPRAAVNQLPTSVPSGLQWASAGNAAFSQSPIRPPPPNIQVPPPPPTSKVCPPPPQSIPVSTTSTTTSAPQAPGYDPSNAWQAPNAPSGTVNGRQQWPHQYPPVPTTGVPRFQSQPIRPGLQTGPPPAEQTQWQRHPAAPQPHMPVSSQLLSGPSIPNNYGVDHLGNQMSHLSMQRSEPIDLLQSRHILPSTPVKPPKVELPQFDSKTSNCSPDVFRCTLTRVPESQSVLQKSRLPLGILIHPFKDLVNLPVVQCNVIVRCRSCRTYINPFVQFVDQNHWKCNLCYRVNELQEEFQYDPISKTYGDPTRRPEIKSATIEFIAPSEYMLRPPQPAVYLFILDVSYSAVETGYLRSFCDTLLEELDKLPGDARTRIGFITFDHALHFYNLAEGLSQPQLMVVSDIEDVFLPCPDNLLVNLNERKELVKDLLLQLPALFMESKSTDSALGAALQAGFKLVSPTGGRITVVQGSLPNIGPGALKAREDPNLRAGKEVPNLGPANDFYKKLSLNCSGQQVAVDLFLTSSQYCDIATLSCISKYSGGCISYYPGFHSQLNPGLAEKFEQDLKRYLTRKIGFEAVMRIRCTKGLSIHTFHGNFFVRSTDLLSLPNINPDAGFAMQMSIEEPLSDCNSACFQAALLYTSSKGERRIRVHTLCLPVTASVVEVINSADQQAIVGLLTRMAVDRSLSSSMSDARDALLNACVDAVVAYKLIQGSTHHALLVPPSLRLLPMYVLAILKHMAFRLGTSTKLDERVFAMNQMKTLPLTYLMTYVYPNMYAVHNLVDVAISTTQNDNPIPQPALLHLSSEKFERQGVFLLDSGDRMFLYVCQGVKQQYCQNVLNAPNFDAIPERMTELPEMENQESELLRQFINHLQSQRPFHATLQVLKNTSKNKQEFLQYLVEDRTESTYSYYEFLKHINQLICK